MFENMYTAIVFRSMLQDPTNKNLAKHKQIDNVVSGLYRERRKQRMRERANASAIAVESDRTRGNAFKFRRTLDSYPHAS